MKLSFIYPPTGVNSNGRNFLWWVSQELKKKVEVVDNDCSEDCDVIICMSIPQFDRVKTYHIRYPKIPLISYNWDWYPWANQNKEYKVLLMKSKEVWSASQDAADFLERATGIKSIPLYGCIVPDEWKDVEIKDYGFAVMASRDEWYKRFDWFESACKELGINYHSFHPWIDQRRNYITGLAQSSILVSPSLYEGFGLTPIEGAYLGKPLVLADTDVFRELWDCKAYFFNPHRYSDFKRVLKKAFEERKFSDNRKYVEENFLPKHMAERMYQRFLANFWV